MVRHRSQGASEVRCIVLYIGILSGFENRKVLQNKDDRIMDHRTRCTRRCPINGKFRGHPREHRLQRKTERWPQRGERISSARVLGTV